MKDIIIGFLLLCVAWPVAKLVETVRQSEESEK